jgi:tetratricopeptide (TPR) repeat protein
LSTIPDEIVSQLKEAVAERRINEVMAVLKELQPQLTTLTLPQKNAAAVMGYAAFCSDLDRTFESVTKALLERFKVALPRGDMTLLELIYLNLTEGMIKLREEQYTEAIEHFKMAELSANHAQNRELRTVARYYLARGYLKTANYDHALTYVKRAKELDEQARRTKRIAVMESLEGLIYLLLGNTKQAEDLFDRAEAGLKGHENENRIECGNLCLFRGRIFRRQARYDQAVDQFRQGIKHYEESDPNHRNIARARVHLAAVYHLKVREEKEKESILQDKQTIQHYRERALRHLEKAEGYYKQDEDRQHQGLGKVHYTRALIYFDQNRAMEAEREAAEAFRLGQERCDHLVMAKARIMQCQLALQVKKKGWRALKLAEEAVQHANETEYPRLQARALIWQGRARLKVLEDVVGAKGCQIAASGKLTEDDQDDLRRIFNQLNQDIKDSTLSDRVIIKLTPADLYNYNPVGGNPQGKKNTPKGTCDFAQIVDEVEESILQYLLGQERRKERVRDRWRVNAAKVSYMNREWTLTEDSLRKLEEQLSENARSLKTLARIRGISEGDSAQLIELRKTVLTALEPLRNQTVMGLASFIGEVKKRIGREETQAIKKELLRSIKEAQKFGD